MYDPVAVVQNSLLLLCSHLTGVSEATSERRIRCDYTAHKAYLEGLWGHAPYLLGNQI